MATKNLYHTTELITTTCWCGIAHAIPDSLYRIAEKDHKHGIYCPLGHEWVVAGKTEAEKLRERLNEEREHSGRVAAERDQALASLSATKGVVTKLKKRVGAGVCPCCNRTFKQLAAHMERQHPEFVSSE